MVLFLAFPSTVPRSLSDLVSRHFASVDFIVSGLAQILALGPHQLVGAARGLQSSFLPIWTGGRLSAPAAWQCRLLPSRGNKSFHTVTVGSFRKIGFILHSNLTDYMKAPMRMRYREIRFPQVRFRGRGCLPTCRHRIPSSFPALYGGELSIQALS
jgi:hypothetical protein